MKIIGIKSSQHSYEFFHELAGDIYYANGPTCMNRNYSELGHKNVTRPLDPLPISACGCEWTHAKE